VKLVFICQIFLNNKAGSSESALFIIVYITIICQICTKNLISANPLCLEDVYSFKLFYSELIF